MGVFQFASNDFDLNSYEPNQNNDEVIYQTNFYEPDFIYEKPINIPDDMSGNGVMDIARSILSAGQKAAEIGATLATVGTVAKKIYTSQLATDIRNRFPDSDENARPGYAGEMHVALKLPNGKMGMSNWMGPHTSVLNRLARGDPGRTEIDKVAKAHDIRYALSTNMNDIRTADNIMINETEKLRASKGDSAQNLFLAKAISAKKKLEDLGVLKRDAFSGDLATKKITPENKAILEKALNQQGYGLKLAGQSGKGDDEELLPGDALKLKLIKNLSKKQKKKVYRVSDMKIKQKGGFWFLLAPIIALITEAVSAVTVASVGSALATGAATAVGSVVAKKILGEGKMKGKGVIDVVKKVAKKIADNKSAIIQAAKTIGIKPDDIPASVKKAATIALELINKAPSADKGGILKIVKTLIPHVRKAFHSKLEKKVKAGSGLGLAGSGLILAGNGIDAKVLNIVKQQI